MKLKSLAPLALLPLFSAQAAANYIDNVYLSASYSNVSYEFTDQDELEIKNSYSEIGSASLADSDSGFQFKVGYQFADFLAIEVGYLNLGEFGFEADIDSTLLIDGNFYNLTGEEYALIEVAGWTVSAVANYQLTEKLTGYARLGLYNWEGEGDGGFTVNLSGNGMQDSNSEKSDIGDLSGNDLFLGVGVSYDLDVVEVYGEFETFNLEDNDDEQEVNSFGVGAIYRF